MNGLRKYNVGKIWSGILPKASELHDHERVLFSQLAEIASSSERILEIGVGRGRMVRLLKEASHTGAEFYGVDLNSYQKYQDVHFILADTRYLPFPDNSFNLTYSLGVVEHMTPVETAMAVWEHIRVTRKDGFLLITTPAKSMLFTPLRYLIYFIKFRKLGTFTEVLGRNLYENELIQTLNEQQCLVLESGRSGVYLPKLPSKLRRAAARFMPPGSGAYLWILAQKK